MANEGAFIYKIITPQGYHLDYKFDRAMKYYERYGSKMYAYTKTLRPITILLYWKKPETAFSNYVDIGKLFAYNEIMKGGM